MFANSSLSHRKHFPKSDSTKAIILLLSKSNYLCCDDGNDSNVMFAFRLTFPQKTAGDEVLRNQGKLIQTVVLDANSENVKRKNIREGETIIATLCGFHGKSPVTKIARHAGVPCKRIFGG